MVLCFQGFALSTGLSKPLHWLLCLPHDICCIFSSVAWHIITSPHKCVDLLNDHQTVAFETCNVLPCTTPVAMLFGHLIFRGQCINVQDPYRRVHRRNQNFCTMRVLFLSLLPAGHWNLDERWWSWHCRSFLVTLGLPFDSMRNPHRATPFLLEAALGIFKGLGAKKRFHTCRCAMPCTQHGTQHGTSLGPKYTAGPDGSSTSTSNGIVRRPHSLLLKQADESITGRLQKLLGIEPGSSKHPHFMVISCNFMRTTWYVMIGPYISRHHLSYPIIRLQHNVRYVIKCHRIPKLGGFESPCVVVRHGDVQSRWSLWSLCMRKFGMPQQRSNIARFHSE